MKNLGRRAEGKVEKISRGGRVGMLFAEIKDADGDKRGEPGFRSRVELILYLARSGEAEKYYDFGVIQMALAVRAWDIWEKLWGEKYPDRGDEWETGFDHGLMRVWRDKVRRLFIEHHQEKVIPMKLDEYVTRLVEGDLDEETAGEIAFFFYKAFHL
ncbi:MAG: hypothetical protein V1789_09415 [PVC group bacterium]